MLETIVVTRHAGLVEYLKEIGIITDKTPVMAEVTADDIRGKHVIGVLPHHLSSVAVMVTEVPLIFPPVPRGQASPYRGRELTLTEVREFAGKPVTYVVRAFETADHALAWENIVHFA